MSDYGIDRRQFVKAVGAAGAAAFAGGAAAAPGEVSTRVLDRQFDPDGGLQEALVVFDAADSADRLGTLDLEKGYHVFETLAIAHTFLTPDQLEAVAGWDEVRRVKRSEELTFYNDGTSRESMAVDAVHKNLGYSGEDTHAVIIDTGIDASHPALQGSVEANYQYVDEPFGERDAVWVDAAPGDTDEFGHGTHCAGIVGGDGTGGAQGDYTGMAPAATITGYSTTQYQYLPYVVAAWDHMLGRAKTDPGFDPDVVSNSYGVARGMPYNPNDPVNVATWKASEMGILPVFAMGNDYNLGTGSRFAKAPHVLGVAAAEKTIDEADNRNDRPIADFSSRGRAYDPERASAEPEKYIADRVYHNREQTLINLREFYAIQNGTHYTVDSGEMSGRFGAGANTDPVIGVPERDADTGSSFETLDVYGNVDLVDLTLSIEPDGQWVRVTVYDEDGEEVAMMGEEVLHQHRTLTFDASGPQTYYVEIEPEDSAAGTYTLAYTQYEKADGELADARPLTLFRPGISTHGVSVMSTMNKYDVLAPLEGFYGGNYSEPFYARLSGTSMACPAAAGVALLVVQAYRETAGEAPAPIDVIRVLEHTAADHNPGYIPANTGAGFVDAEAAVGTAEKLAGGELTVGDLDTGLDALVEPPEPDLQPALAAGGSRDDGATAFTAGQTARIEITVSDLAFEEADDLPVSADTEVRVHDVVPASWTVYETADAEGGADEPENGTKHVPLGTVTPAEVDGDSSATFVYYAQTPDQTGAYTFGPAGAHVTVDGTTLSATFGGTETNYVVGQSTALQ